MLNYKMFMIMNKTPGSKVDVSVAPVLPVNTTTLEQTYAAIKGNPNCSVSELSLICGLAVSSIYRATRVLIKSYRVVASKQECKKNNGLVNKFVAV